MEFFDYVRIARKWWWLALIAMVVVGGIAYVVSSSSADVYQAEVMLSVGGFIQSPNPDSSDIRTGVDLAQNYAVLAKTFVILDKAVQAGQFELTADDLNEMVATRVLPNTSMLVLTVDYVDPVLAADIANEVAQQLVLNSPSNLTPAQQNQLELANAEIDKLNTQLQDTRAQLQLVDQQIAENQTEAERTLLQARRDTLLEQINQASGTLADFSSTVAVLQERTNSLDIVEPARIPTEPVGPDTMSMAFLGAIVGFGLAAVAAMLFEYLDDTLHQPDQVTQGVGLPVIGTINKFGKTRAKYPDRLIALNDPGSPSAEGYRTLRTKLLFSFEQEGTQTYIVTSVGPREGKSVTSANLAVTLASAGLNVLLIDADLRRPKIHQIFELSNAVGLADLLTMKPLNEGGSIGEVFPSADLSEQCLQETPVPGLHVITSGDLPLDPTEVLGSSSMRQWYSAFLAASDVDVVIFDAPPLMAVSDSLALGGATGAPAILVVEAGKTRRRDVIRAKEQLEKLSVGIKGVVLNQITSRDAGYSYDYYYYTADTGPKERLNTRPVTPKEKQE